METNLMMIMSEGSLFLLLFPLERSLIYPSGNDCKVH
ncbi:hypothetical protein PRIPAC_87354 [Pristionchus pacificus]|nr:hypothetical protein PRIPAC_87354 [Pristionchus pacificus]